METNTELRVGKTRFRRWGSDGGEGQAGKESGSFMSLCDDRLSLTLGTLPHSSGETDTDTGTGTVILIYYIKN